MAVQSIVHMFESYFALHADSLLNALCAATDTARPSNAKGSFYAISSCRFAMASLERTCEFMCHPTSHPTLFDLMPRPVISYSYSLRLLLLLYPATAPYACI